MQIISNQKNNPYLFVVGCPRSGTTLLKRMIDAHPHIAITRETHWIPRYFKKRIGLTREGLVTPELIPKLFEYHRFSHLEIDHGVLEKMIKPDEPLSYAQFVSRLFDLYGQSKGKHIVGDKTPGYVRHIPILHTLWPKAKFVHIIRDGRDVCLSMLNWRMAHRAVRYPTWKEDPVSTIAFWWKWHVGLGLENGRVLKQDRYYELHYENLVLKPADECAKLCSFLNLPYDDAMLKYNEGRTRTDPGLSTNRAWSPPTSGLRNWRTQMATGDVEQFEAAAGDILDKLCYPRNVSKLSPDALEHAAEIRSLFQVNRLPECW